MICLILAEFNKIYVSENQDTASTTGIDGGTSEAKREGPVSSNEAKREGPVSSNEALREGPVSSNEAQGEGPVTALLMLDHMRSKVRYTHTILKWATGLALAGCLLFVGKFIFIVLQGHAANVKVKSGTSV